MTRGARRADDGFTLIELMVVVLIIAILLAIAIPTYLGARDRANNRAAQSNLRNAHTNQLVWFADQRAQPYTNDPDELKRLESSLDWTDDPADLNARPGSVYVYLDTVNSHPAVIVATRSRSGRCFWLRAVSNEDHPRFASNDCSVPVNPTLFGPSWT